ncbi:MAG: hypothetical protein JWQ98_609 [Chlorobi bacterium]|nr:hypothetical protein [Chlorobiota bacterium]
MLALALLAHPHARAQSIDSLFFSPLRGAPSRIGIADLFVPTGLRVGYQTREWVRDSLPPAGDSLDDLARMDMIYMRSIGEAGGDLQLALFGSLIASFEHKTIPFTFGLHLPLTLEPEAGFNKRVARLPDRIFLDQPRGNDRDKLQHFFASAWLAWTFDNDGTADLIGIGIEEGEELFIRGGANDPRDVRANRLGQLFAELLRTYPRALPSTIIRAWNEEYARRAGEVTK